MTETPDMLLINASAQIDCATRMLQDVHKALRLMRVTDGTHLDKTLQTIVSSLIEADGMIQVYRDVS